MGPWEDEAQDGPEEQPQCTSTSRNDRCHKRDGHPSVHETADGRVMWAHGLRYIRDLEEGGYDMDVTEPSDDPVPEPAHCQAESGYGPCALPSHHRGTHETVFGDTWERTARERLRDASSEYEARRAMDTPAIEHVATLSPEQQRATLHQWQGAPVVDAISARIEPLPVAQAVPNQSGVHVTVSIATDRGEIISVTRSQYSDTDGFTNHEVRDLIAIAARAAGEAV